MDSLLPLQFNLFISASDLLMDRSFDCLSIPYTHTHTARLTSVKVSLLWSLV